MFREEYTPWKRGHLNAENDVCKPGAKEYRGYDWFSNGAPDKTANGTNSAELIRAQAVDFLSRQAHERRQGRHKPFFLYLPFQNIHAPYDVEGRSSAPRPPT